MDSRRGSQMSVASTSSSSNSPPPPDPEQLKIKSHFEYSTAIPLKEWLRTATVMLKYGKGYAMDGSYDETFILYRRYLDLFINKLPNHPDLRAIKADYKRNPNSKQALIYKEYRSKLKNETPEIMRETEKLFKSLNDNYQSYLESEKRKKQLIELQELKFAKLKEQQFLQLQQQQRTNELRKNSSSAADLELTRLQEEALSRKIRSLSSSSMTGLESLNLNSLPTYPDLPVFDDHSPELPKKPVLPSKSQAPIIPSLPSPSLPHISTSNQVQIPPTLPAKPQTQVQLQSVNGSSSKQSHISNKSKIEKELLHKTVNSTEGGSPLRSVFLPSTLIDTFLKIAKRNTSKKLETCGILCGKLNRNAFFITYLIIPEQENTPNTCSTKNEEKLFEVIDNLDLFVLGWIHTHPTQSCFLSSVDLHTQNSYQIMLNEAIAIVCSPSEKFEKNLGIFRLTDPPGVPTITNCSETGFHPHGNNDKDLYVECHRLTNDIKSGHVVIKNDLPFETTDLREKKR